ncbi:MAG: glycogen debranching enzyme GlgX, partial [Gemmataceae bacterium]
DVNWFDPAGHDLNDTEWADELPCFGMRLAGDLMDETDEYGVRVTGDTLLVILNSGNEVSFTLPSTNPEHRWHRLLDTGDPAAPGPYPGGSVYPVAAHSLALFVAKPVPEAAP